MIRQFERMTLFLGGIFLATGGSGASLQAQCAAPPTPSVQIVSVTVHPETIHKELRPRSATIRVVLHIDGPTPPGAKAEVSVSSCSGQPPNNDAVYLPPIISVPLKGGTIVRRVKIQSGPQMVSGSIVACVDILEHGRDPSTKTPLTVSGFPIRWPVAAGAPWQKISVKTLAP